MNKRRTKAQSILPLSKVFLIVILAFTLCLTVSANNFKDIEEHWVNMNGTLQWAIDNNVATGFPDGTFKPNDNVTEAQFLAMLIRNFAFPEEVQGENWYDTYYNFAESMNYPIGSNPNGVITRTHVAEIVSSTQGVNYKGDHAIQYLLGHGLAKGKDSNRVTIRGYEGYATLTRAEAVQFIKNLVDAGITEIVKRPDQLSDPNLLPKLPGQSDEAYNDNQKLKSITQTVGELHRLADEYGFQRDDRRNLESGYTFRGGSGNSVQVSISDTGEIALRVNYRNKDAVELGIQLARTNGINASENQIREAMEESSKNSNVPAIIRMDNGDIYLVNSWGNEVTISKWDQ